MNNGELTFQKAYTKVKHGAIPQALEEMDEYIEAACYVDSLIDDVIKTLDWMIKHFKWKHRQQLGMEDEQKYPDSEINWSPEILKAIEVLEKLKT